MVEVTSVLSTKKTMTPYYRQYNESIGDSLYRDFENRQKR